jgi:hypothetical protein
MNHHTDRSDFNRQARWQGVYSNKQSIALSGYQQHPEHTIELIKATGVDLSVAMIDIGRQLPRC